MESVNLLSVVMCSIVLVLFVVIYVDHKYFAPKRKARYDRAYRIAEEQQRMFKAVSGVPRSTSRDV